MRVTRGRTEYVLEDLLKKTAPWPLRQIRFS
jgi:hypothetical protein